MRWPYLPSLVASTMAASGGYRRRSSMKRTNTTLWSIAVVVLAMAVAAAPAAARTDINSTNQVSSDPGVPFRVHPQGTVPDRTASPSESVGYRSLNSITGAEFAPPEAATVVTQSSGFEWDDALVGALGALGLMFVSLVTVRAMRRHHRLTVESRA
jgi:hypothetical protein